MLSRKLIFIGSLLFIIGIACTPAQKNEVVEVTQEIEKESKQEWSELKANMIALRNDIDQEIKELDVEMDKATADSKEEIVERKQELEKWRKDVSSRIDRMGDEMNDGWKDFVEDTEDYYEKVKENLTS